MTIRVLSPLGGVIEPIMSPEIAWTREVRSSLLQPVDRQTPFVILKFPDSRAGVFEFLVADIAGAEQAETILGHGQVLTYENTDRAAGPILNNLVDQPYSDVGGGISGVAFVSGDGGTVTPAVQTSPSGDPFTGGSGPVTRYTWDTAGTSTAGLDLLRGDTIPITPGQYAAVVWQLRPGTGMNNLTLRSQAQWLDEGADNGTENGDPVVAGLVHTAAAVVGPAPANTTNVRADLDWAENRSLNIGDWFDYVGHLVGVYDTFAEAEAAAAQGYFDGDKSAGGGLTSWEASANASPSQFVPDGALTWDFVVTGRIELRRNLPYRSWLVRCGFREV